MPNDITEAAYPDVETWKDISINPNITVFYPKTTTTQYEAAKYYLEDVINNGGYELYPNFSELFKSTNKHSCESIWEVEYKTGQVEGLGSPFYTLSHLLLMHLVIKPIQTDISRLPFQIKETVHAHRPDILWIWQKWDSMYPDYQYEVRNLMILSTPIHALATVISN